MRAIVLVALGALALVACNIGNKSAECSGGKTCVCDILGNCDYSCPAGTCHFVCSGTGNCDFDCAGGGCDLTCTNTGNCELTCPDHSCALSCQGTGNCDLKINGVSVGADAGH